MTNTNADLYDETLARVYDAMYSNPADDAARLDFFAGLTPDSGSFCDLGAGTGTIVAAMSERGFSAVGVDNSPAMLRRFRDRIAGTNAEAVEADMFTLQLGRQFDTVTLVTNTFYIALTQDRQLQLLQAALAHLHENSTLVVEAFDPVRFHAAVKPELSIRYLSESDAIIDDYVVDPAQQLLVARHTLLGQSGPDVRSHVIRYAFVSEMFLLARCVGLEVTGVFRDWGGTPYGQGAQRYVLTMRRAR
ncbi:class I SAM-dependent methyltransferase [Rhodococcus qingshengii]|uniref:class I SAM-dependent methyltransferase n=1 Tax=Rhodococcus qingshengii TaxID=334542 RepID=UPI00237C5D9F|nr:class I SAM-dependent methyltransferase [Rhodococcus qingshengii]WCT06156.1 class I SAM-dependent methyltransferase [Rhodococcus qingshengii]